MNVVWNLSVPTPIRSNVCPYMAYPCMDCAAVCDVPRADVSRFPVPSGIAIAVWKVRVLLPGCRAAVSARCGIDQQYTAVFWRLPLWCQSASRKYRLHGLYMQHWPSRKPGELLVPAVSPLLIGRRLNVAKVSFQRSIGSHQIVVQCVQSR